MTKESCKLKRRYRAEVERVLRYVTLSTIMGLRPESLSMPHIGSLLLMSFGPQQMALLPRPFMGRGISISRYGPQIEKIDGMENSLIPVDHTSTVTTPARHFLPPFDGRAFLAFLSASTLRDFLMSSLLLISRLLPAPSLNLPILFSLASATLFLRST